MAWHIFPSHHVAHLNPTLGNGWGSQDGYPVENVNTLNERDMFRTDSSGAPSGNLIIDFDRGHTNGTGLNAALLISNTVTGPGHGWNIVSDDNAGFPSTTSLVSSDTTKAHNIYWPFASTTTERYLRFEWTRTSGNNLDFGCLTFGKTYQIAETGPVRQTMQLGGRSIRTFRNVSRTNADAIMEAYAKRYIATTEDSSGEIDALGGAGGENPIALIDDSTSPATVYWGRANLRLRGFGAYYSELEVDMERIYTGVLTAT